MVRYSQVLPGTKTAPSRPSSACVEQHQHVGVALRLQRLAVGPVLVERHEVVQSVLGDRGEVARAQPAHEAQPQHVAQLGPAAQQLGRPAQQRRRAGLPKK